MIEKSGEKKDLRLYFAPTKEQEEVMSRKCSICIDVLCSLPTLGEKAYALRKLVESFEDVSNVKIVDKWYGDM
jgi:hypothetical protein